MIWARLRCRDPRREHIMGAIHRMADGVRTLCGAGPRNSLQYWEEVDEAEVDAMGYCYNCRKIMEARR